MRDGGRRDNSYRQAFSNRGLVAITFAEFTNTINEWAMYIATIVYAYERGGATVAGFASLAILFPVCIAAPLAGVAAERYPAARLLVATHVVEASALAAAAATAMMDAPIAVTVACCALAQGGITFTRPVIAFVTPGVVRTARELTVANVWSSMAENASMLLGPLLATGMLAVSGPPATLTVCAVLAFLGAMLMVPIARREPRRARRELRRLRRTQLTHDVGEPSLGVFATVRHSVREVRRLPSAFGVLGAIGATYMLVGALDLVFVVYASEVLGMSESGPGLLSSAVGAGAVISSLAATRLVRRPRLAPLIVGGIATIALAVATLATAGGVPAALALLAVVGFCKALIVLASRMLLQRSAPPGSLAAMFAMVELLVGLSMFAGSIGAQAVIAASGAPAALYALGGLLVALLALTWRSLRKADDAATVPVVAISLLRRLPLFQPLPPLALEAVARAAQERTVTAGGTIITEGEAGHHFFAVADGTFDVTKSGRRVDTLERGAGFGEVALLADVARTATVTARTAGVLLTIERGPFLDAVTGCDSSFDVAWTAIRRWEAAPPPTDVSDD